MSNESNAVQPPKGEQSQGQAVPVAAPSTAKPVAPAYDPQRAEHEAAHAVVIDDLGYRVIWVNIKAGIHNGEQLYQMTKADWGEFDKAVKTINWDDAAQRDAIRPAVLEYVTSLVAGHLADNLATKGKVERVSTRIQNASWLLKKPPNMKNAQSDRDKTALYLFLIQRNTIGEVVAAEQRALEILTRRQVHRNALAELLVTHGTAEGEMLDNALGKTPTDQEGKP